MAVAFHVTGFGPFGQGEVTANPTQARARVLACSAPRPARRAYRLTRQPTQLLVESLPAAVASGRFPLPAGAALASTAVLATSSRAAAAYVAQLPCRAGRQCAPGPTPPPAAVCVLHLGVHTGAARLRLERCAWNEATFRCADEAGWAPQGECVLGADAPGCRRESTLPVDALAAGLAAAGWPVEPSDDPGRFVCNYTYYLTLQATQEEPAAAPADQGEGAEDAAPALPQARAATQPPWHALFVHVPPAAVMPVEQQTNFLAALMGAITAHLLGATAEPR